jgi:murein tripeptide amidase MpaA
MQYRAFPQRQREVMVLEIDSAFECGNIEVVRTDGAAADLKIRVDSNGPWYQWFYFRVRGGQAQALTLRIVNAGQSAYPDGWREYRACVSADNANWRRAETSYADGVLEIRHAPQTAETRFAFFTPYDLTRFGDWLEAARSKPGIAVRTIGKSVDRRDVTALSIGSGPKHVWLVGRQHSGETMASWWMEGALDRLIDPHDPLAARLRRMATIHMAPLVNIDGAARGNLRGNAAGIDLNRQWHSPDPQKAPEVAGVLAEMDRTGVDFALDVHGDETLQHVFTDGCDHDPAATPRQIAGVAAFNAALLKASPAFQTAVGYPVTYGGDGAPGMCCRAVARRYGCIGLTLEMPFNDSREAPDPVHGWSPASSARMGRDCLEAIAAVLEG